MTVIPPLLVNKKLVTDLKVKANIFNDFFSKHCTPLANGSKLPENQVYLTNWRINSIPFSDNLVIKIIRNLNVNKVHVHGNISMRMIEMCGESLVRPLSITIPNSCIYPRTCKKQTWYQFINKMTGNVWQLPPCVFGKIFEKLICSEIYSFLDREKLFSTNQSGFRPSDSCINQLLIILHNIFSSFDYNLH